MKVLLVHNYYREPGGESLSFEDEARLLENRDVDVVRYTLHNAAVERMARVTIARRAVWNRQSYAEIRAVVRRERPALVHCTNIFPLISPSAHAAARAEGVPVVQALRNYRPLCPNALFFRNGAPCEDCLGKKIPWPGVVHACYRGSRAASAAVAGMVAIHHLTRRWRNVDLFITPTQFSKGKFVEAGFPAERIAVKPNFIDPDPGPGDGSGGYAVFVGRFSGEKGIAPLLAAWSQVPRQTTLKLVGDGPLAPEVQAATRRDPRIEWLGWRPFSEVLDLIGRAALLVMPSQVYETFGRTIIEAFARGTPVLAARRGAMAELVDDGRTGALFEAGDTADLARAATRLLAAPARLARMRLEARREYESRYTADHAFAALMDAYGRLVTVPQTIPRPATPVSLAATGVVR